jgi:hypothetical protein
VLTVLGTVPYVNYCTGIVSLLLSLYILYIQITAVKAVNRFGWGPAAGSVLIPAFVIIFICGCLAFGGVWIFRTASAISDN